MQCSRVNVFLKGSGGVWQGGVEGRQFSEGGGGHKEGV